MSKQQKNQLQQQLNDLLAVKDFVNIDKQFIQEYIVKTQYKIDQKSMKQVQKSIECLIDIRHSEGISQQNFIQIIVILADTLKNLQKYQINDLFTFYKNCIKQLSGDDLYLQKNYFLPKQPPKDAGKKFSDFLKQQQQRKVSMASDKYKLGDCPVCLIQITNQDICALLCNHIIHKVCFIEWMKENINKKKLPLKCPFEGCPTLVESRDIEEYLPKQLVDKFYEFSLHNFVDKNSNYISWCPTAGCETVFEFDSSLLQYKCPKCQQNYCLKCKSKQHPNLSCQENQNFSKQDQQFFKHMEDKNYKQCPKCKFWVERAEGCGHMTCRCGFQFCYYCELQYGKCFCQNQVADYWGEQQQQSDDDEEYEKNMKIEQNFYRKTSGKKGIKQLYKSQF